MCNHAGDGTQAHLVIIRHFCNIWNIIIFYGFTVGFQTIFLKIAFVEYKMRGLIKTQHNPITVNFTKTGFQLKRVINKKLLTQSLFGINIEYLQRTRLQCSAFNCSTQFYSVLLINSSSSSLSTTVNVISLNRFYYQTCFLRVRIDSATALCK